MDGWPDGLHRHVGAFPDDTSLGVGTSSLFNEVRLSQDSLRTLSDETGGFAVVNRNDFTTAFQRIQDDRAMLSGRLTDMYGGTPCNIAMTFFQPGKVEVLTGVNLPMVLRLACQMGGDKGTVSDLAHWLQDKGQRSVCLAGEMGNGKGCGPKCEVPQPVPAGAGAAKRGGGETA